MCFHRRTDMKNSIVICMGSSCFARGNRDHLELIENYLDGNGITAEIQFSGCRCRGECGRGPNIEINGTLHHEVDTGTLLDLMEYYFSAVRAEV
ncbi:(2Fe-2S) ferredoxin domain-containing protein [Pontiellaceae bacterium B1224]|nr:(2Fe-2S) ferredoxin domain-containing protein [Pontiellaceae bacterium B1224]